MRSLEQNSSLGINDAWMGPRNLWQSTIKFPLEIVEQLGKATVGYIFIEIDNFPMKFLTSTTGPPNFVKAFSSAFCGSFQGSGIKKIYVDGEDKCMVLYRLDHDPRL